VEEEGRMTMAILLPCLVALGKEKKMNHLTLSLVMRRRGRDRQAKSQTERTDLQR